MGIRQHLWSSAGPRHEPEESRFGGADTWTQNGRGETSPPVSRKIHPQAPKDLRDVNKLTNRTPPRHESGGRHQRHQNHGRPGFLGRRGDEAGVASAAAAVDDDGLNHAEAGQRNDDDAVLDSVQIAEAAVLQREHDRGHAVAEDRRAAGELLPAFHAEEREPSRIFRRGRIEMHPDLGFVARVEGLELVANQAQRL